ncbi:MAG: hypothetical protein KatS3mg014_0232 [Actinomycetota bacterium]|nr:MAG: hypothetical protein KatS3mg014_0232 [Actinomycetota bacterium]
MRYVAVLVVSLTVGTLVYLLSLRAPRRAERGPGFEPPDEPAGVRADPSPGYTYLRVPVDARGPSPGERLQGLLGSLALVAMGAVALAARRSGPWASSSVGRSARTCGPDRRLSPSAPPAPRPCRAVGDG